MAGETNFKPIATSFLGRERDVGRLQASLRTGRQLTTILGPFGAGKTRLARVVTSSIADEFVSGVWFCDLTETSTRGDVVESVARALDVPLLQGENSEVTLAAALEARGQILLILDNLEQVVDAGRDLIAGWCEKAPGCQFVVTSRIKLNLANEFVYPLEPLEAAVAARLFVERARRAAPNFEIAQDDEHVVHELVKRLDGLPLAIELAAGRATVLPPAELVDRLDRRFELIRSKRPDLTPRQATLEGAIAWSWDLLDDHERATLAQCSVFASGFSLEAAERVIEVDALTIDSIDELQMNSLVRIEPSPSNSASGRFHLYESVRRFAAERLVEMGLVSETMHRLGDYLIERGSIHLEGLDSRDCARHLAWLEDEYHTLESLVRHEAVEPKIAVSAVLILHPLLQRRGPYDKHTQLLDKALEFTEQIEDELRIRLWVARAELHLSRGEWPAAQTLLDEAITLAPQRSKACIEAGISRARCERLMGDLSGAIETAQAARQICEEENFKRLGSLALGNLILARTADAGSIEAEDFEALEHARRLASKAGDLRVEAFVSNTLGTFHANVGHHEEARWAYAHVREVATTLKDRRLEGIATSNLGLIDHMQGDVESAELLFRHGLELARTLGNRREAAIMMGNLGAVLTDRAEWDDAMELLTRGLRTTRELDDERAGAVILGTLGAAHHARGNLARADELYEEASTLHARNAAESHLLQIVLFRAILALEKGQKAEAERFLERILEWPGPARTLWSDLAKVLQQVASGVVSDASVELTTQGLRPLRVAAQAARHLNRSSGMKSFVEKLHSPQDGVAPVERWIGIRLVARLLDSDQAFEPEALKLAIDSNFYWFELAAQERVDIRRRGPARLLLEAFVRNHAEEPGEPLDLDALFQAGWPDEKISLDAANKRVYAAIGTLRRLGFSDVLLTVDEGYLLDPSLDIELK